MLRVKNCRALLRTFIPTLFVMKINFVYSVLQVAASWDVVWSRAFCSTMDFTASCPEDSAVVMTQALHGRMNKNVCNVTSQVCALNMLFMFL